MSTILETATHIQSLVKPIQNEYFSREQPQTGYSRAMTLWAMKTILLGFDLSNEDLVRLTTIDGCYDCGIDGWFYEDDDGSGTLHIFQTKAIKKGTPVPVCHLEELRHSIAALLNKDRKKNQDARQLASDLKNWIAAENFSVKMYFITTGELTSGTAADALYQTYREEPEIVVQQGYKETRIPCEYLVYTSDGLIDAHIALLTTEGYFGGGGNTIQNFRIFNPGSPACYEIPTADEPSLFCTTYASDVASAFNGPPKKWFLFTENPRGAQQKKNKSIYGTLSDKKGKKRFHINNNGLSIVCSEYELVRDSKEQITGVNLHHPRIVNGCQTTVTLGEALSPSKGDSILDETVLLNLKITKTDDHDLRADISRATNTQKQVTAADMASLSDELKQYQHLFGQHNPPYFFEIQSGNWDYMLTNNDKSRYEARIERDALAQSVMAINGRPGEALEDKRYIFVKSTSDPRGRFEEVFESQIPPETMILSWRVLERIRGELQIQDRIYVEALSKTPPEIPNVTNRPEALRYSLLHRVWLTSKILSQALNLNSFSSLTPKAADALAENIESWFPAVYAPVSEAISDGIDRLSDHYQGVETRNFFRQGHSVVKINKDDVGTLIPNQVFLEKLKIAYDRRGVRDNVTSSLLLLNGESQ